MKKTLLLLVTALLVAGLVIGCSQAIPTDGFNVTVHVPSAPGVASDKISYTAYNGFNLVKWEQAEDNNGTDKYIVYRRELNANNDIVDGTVVQISTSSSKSNDRFIPYYQDDNVKAGVRYQYGIVTKGYKAGGSDVIPVSDIIWQSFSDSNPAAAAVKSIPTDDRVKPTTLKYEGHTKKNTKTGGTNNVWEEVFVEFSGINPEFSYDFYLDYTTTAAASLKESDWKKNYAGGSPAGTKGTVVVPGGTSDQVLNSVVENGGKIVVQFKATQAGNETDMINPNWQSRVYVKYAVDSKSEGNLKETVSTSLTGEDWLDKRVYDIIVPAGEIKATL